MSNEKADLKRLKMEIASLNSQSKKIRYDKEEWFKKKEDLKKEISILIEKVRNFFAKESRPQAKDRARKQK